MFPAPAFAEVPVGEGNGPEDSDIEASRRALDWGEVYAVDKRTAVTPRRSPTRWGRRDRP